MDELQLIQQDGELNKKDKEVLSKGMLAHHASQGHERKVEYSSILLRNKEGKLVGCVTISFLWNGMEILTLWVDDSIRGQGWGTKLMQAAEDEGVKRGADFAYTNTFSWQAPEFYQKLGYTLYGKLENFPEGDTLSYFRKDLKA